MVWGKYREPTHTQAPATPHKVSREQHRMHELKKAIEIHDENLLLNQELQEVYNEQDNYQENNTKGDS